MYEVQFIGDDALPEGHDFMYVDLPDGGVAFLRESAVNPRTLEDAWAAYRAAQARPRVYEQARLRQFA
jgi:hypothetical protein